MTHAVEHTPRFPAAHAERVAAEHFDVAGTAVPLPGERDQNFRIEGPAGPLGVLKFVNPLEDVSVLDLQHAALTHLAANAPAVGVPYPMPTRSGGLLVEEPGPRGTTQLVRMLAWVPGRPWAEVRPHDASLFRSLGLRLGEMVRGLQDFHHPALVRDFPWDLARAAWIAEDIPEHPSSRQPLLRDILARYECEVVPRLGLLRRGALHNDWNDHNVLVSGSATPREVVGIIDFGDMIEGPVVADLAVALAYALQGQREPLGAATAVVAAFNAVHPLETPEIEVLYDLFRTRLALSAVMARRQQDAAPENAAYLGVSQPGVWTLLERTAPMHPRFVRAAFRAAAGHHPDPSGPLVSQWIRNERSAERLADLLPPELAGPAPVLDLSVGSPDLDRTMIEDATALDRQVQSLLRARGSLVGIGRYDEPRLLYQADGFAGEGEAPGARRTVHLGIDLFAPAGTPLFAPLEGTVQALADNDRPLDYGPTLILSHHTGSGETFFTLYGHLDPEVLDSWRVGATVRRGERIARVGAMDRNGGWSPHVHVQVITDLLDAQGDFPGVCRPGEAVIWRGLSPDPSDLLGVYAARAGTTRPDMDLIAAARARHAGQNLSLSYRSPLVILRGMGCHLYDPDGRAYLDCVNNVAHVGHAHPRVVAAERGQAGTLNTNTRYLHPLFAEYSRRLVALFPEPLSVLFLVNSGSEANELALRLARSHTRRQGAVVLEAAYHGNTRTLVDLSPYKHRGPGGCGTPAWVQVAAAPDPYRGIHRDPSDAGVRYGALVAQAFLDAERGGCPAGVFFLESLMSCAGQIDPPPGYLPAAYAAARRAGALVVADEVQVGFGRVGDGWWGFEAEGCVPDIVTLGKPMGNGHPIGGVVTTRAIADSFANGMEFFSTYGGNPVSCAVGLAVLDVIEDEALMARARDVGGALWERLEVLAARWPLIGDVRGRGLFLGVELVDDRNTRAAAAPQTRYVVERMKDAGILLSLDGPLHNVLKIKPPMAFGEEDAERLASTLGRILEEDGAQPAKSGEITPPNS